MEGFKSHKTITQDQSHKACKLLSDLSNNMGSVTEMVYKLIEQVKNGDFDTKKGLSLLDLKNNMFLSYMCNLMFTTRLKLAGKSLDKNPVVDRLIEQRLVIERLGPFENKLKYQIEKYLKADSTGNIADLDSEEEIGGKKSSSGLKATDFATGDSDQEQQSDDEGQYGVQEDAGAGGQSDLRYRVPKVSQNKFPETSDHDEKLAAARRRLLNSTMMQDALFEHSQDPEVLYDASSLQMKAIKKREEITQYEEDNLTRVAVSKRDRAVMRATSTAGAMHGELLGFRDVSLLSGGGGERPAKKRKTEDGGKKRRKGKGKKKGGKKRH